jgi:exonuclease SbcC
MRSNARLPQSKRQVAALEDRSREQASVQAKIDGLQREIQQIDSEDPALHEQEQIVAALSVQLAQGDFAHNERAALAAIDRQIAALGYSRERYDQAQADVNRLAPLGRRPHRRLHGAEEWLAENRDELARAAERLRQLDAQIAADEEEVRSLDETPARPGASRARAR